MWDDVRAEYMMHLSTDVEGKVWLAKADAESERIVEQAIVRYDYIIIYKNYEHDDFINRQTSPSVDVLDSANSVNYANNNIVMITILIVSLSTISASILLLAFKKYMKKKER